MGFDVRRFDIYRKIPKDLTQPTLTGAIVSICCCIFIAVLFISEFHSYIKPELVSELFVDPASSNEERIPVRLNLTLTSLKCAFVGLDIQDDLGRHEVGFVEDTDKLPVGENGCQFVGKFYINKVPGNFHISTHSLGADQPDDVDMQHTIHELKFGDEIQEHLGLPSSYNTLSGKVRTGQASETHEYFLKVVPTIFSSSGREIHFYQYTYAYKHYTAWQFSGRAIPAIWFRYDLSPLTVRYHFKMQPLYGFLTMLCAIIGGTFTVAGIIDSCIFSASELLRKSQLGKLS